MGHLSGGCVPRFLLTFAKKSDGIVCACAHVCVHSDLITLPRSGSLLYQCLVSKAMKGKVVDKPKIDIV